MSSNKALHATEVDETAISEITIGPDGRIYVFGTSYEVLRVLARLWPGDASLQARLRSFPGSQTSDGTSAIADELIAPSPARLEHSTPSRQVEGHCQ